MKKLSFVLLLFITCYCNGQVGLKLTGQTFINGADSAAITAIYVIPHVCFDGVTTTTVQFFPAVSPYKAWTKTIASHGWGFGNYLISINGSGYPTRANVFSQSTTYFQGLGFTVTTF